jgi:CSLREA domain-containing protein
MAFSWPGAAQATILVTSTGDTVAADGVCTLREAIEAINTSTSVNECIYSAGIDSITLTTGPIVLGSALPALGSMTIQGNGHTVSGNGITRVFDIPGGSVVTIEDLTISDGNAGSAFGGGIRVNNNAQLTLNRCTLTGNQAGAGGGLRSIGANAMVEVNDCLIENNQTPDEGGGGINNDTGSTMTITRSTIVGNSGRFAGGIANYNGAVMTIRNSTISGNSCTDANAGGGVENFNGESILNIESSTITNNSCGGSNSGGGIYNNTTAPALINTIVAGNQANRPDLSGSFSSLGNNLIGDRTGSTGFINGLNGDQVGSNTDPIDPMLDELADNGGPTPTHALFAGSPAIDNGNNDVAPATDQRGDGFPRIVQGVIDIGAFERCDPLPIIITSIGSGLGEISPASASVACGHSTIFTLTPEPGYSIDSVGGTCPGELDGDEFSTGPITQDCQVVANFSQDPIDAQCGQADGETFTSTPTDSLCDTGQASAVTGDGPWFWSCQGIAGGEDASCSAEIQHYTLTYLAADNGEIVGERIQSVPHGGSGEAVTAEPAEGYAFAGWSDGDESNPRTETNVTDDLSVQASFLEQTALVLSSDSDLSLINQAKTFKVEVVGAWSASQDGEVMIEADSGESCAAQNTGTTGAIAMFECDIIFSEAGNFKLTATFSGSSTHQASSSEPLVQRVVESLIIFRDRFETTSSNGK